MATGTVSANLLLPRLGVPTLFGSLSIFPSAALSGVLSEQGVILSGTLLPVTSAITGYSGASGTFALQLELPALALLPGSALLADLPAGVFSGTMVTGNLGALLASGPVLVPVLSAYSDGVGAVSGLLPLARPSVTLLVGTYGSFSGTVGRVVPAFSGLVGSVGTAAGILAVPVLLVSGYGPYIGTMGGYLTLPILEADAAQAIAAAFRAWALNTRHRALTEYDNFGFNSFALFNGKVVAAGPAGVFELSGQDDDAGTDIAASILTGAEDFGTSFNKRVPRIYAGYVATGPLYFRTVVSKDGVRVYLLPYNGQTALQQRRVPVGRGPKSRYWQFGVANKDGADFTISDILVYPERTVRRVL